MISVGDKYILPGKDDHDRLRMISEIHDGRTQALLKRAGLSANSRFVEFGCGLGYVTRWAAAGRISSIRTPGGHRRFRESEVRALLEGEEELTADAGERRAH